MIELLDDLKKKLYDGDAPGVVALTERALAGGMTALEVLNRGLLPGMEEVGRDFKEGELFIPEVIVAARAMHKSLEILKPLLAVGVSNVAHKIIVGTVKGDMHDIGKKLVGIMMQGAGFEVVDLGHDVAPERFVQAARDEKPEIIGLSALLSTTMPMMKQTIDALRGNGLYEQVKVMVGGAPVTQAWADQIGAHGYAPDAVSAVDCAKKLVER